MPAEDGKRLRGTAKAIAMARSADAPPVKEAGSFNKFFPADGVEGMKRIYTQEKTGFVAGGLGEESPAGVLGQEPVVAEEQVRLVLGEVWERVLSHVAPGTIR